MLDKILYIGGNGPAVKTLLPLQKLPGKPINYLWIIISQIVHLTRINTQIMQFKVTLVLIH